MEAVLLREVGTGLSLLKEGLEKRIYHKNEVVILGVEKIFIKVLYFIIPGLFISFFKGNLFS